MSNHVHLIVVPSTEKSLSQAIGQSHEMYSKYINSKNNWSGLFWQSRFKSYPMDEKHLYHCYKYIELNPVKAGLVKKAEEYIWSSARAHLDLVEDALVNINESSKMTDNWKTYLQEGLNRIHIERIESHRNSGFPIGEETFIKKLEMQFSRCLRPKRPGPKLKK